MVWFSKLLSVMLLVGLLKVSFAQSPLRQGMELSYKGEVKVHEDRFLTATVQVTDLVLEVQEGKKTVVASFRSFAPQIEGQNIPPEAGLRFLSIGSEGEESAVGIEQLIVEVPPFPFPRQFLQILPVYFLPVQKLVSGKSWTAKERVFLPLELEGEIKYTVKGREKLGDNQCFTVNRTLLKPLPIPQAKDAQVLRVNDTLWVDEKLGIVRQVQREFVLQVREGRTLTTNLQVKLEDLKVLDETTFSQRLKELQAVKEFQQKLGLRIVSRPSEEVLDEAEKDIDELLQKFPNTPYRIYWQTWQRVTQILKQQVQRRQKQDALVGQPAPDFELPTADKKQQFKLRGLKGKVVVLNFFAHWCGPCNAEAPRLEKEFWQVYKDKGVVVIGVAVWAEGDPFELAKEFIKKHKLTYPVLVDESEDGKVAQLYGVVGVPTNVVIDKEGKIRYLQAGFDPEGMKRAIEEALK